MRSVTGVVFAMPVLFFLWFGSTIAGAEDQGIGAAPDELGHLLTWKIDNDGLVLDREAWTAPEEKKEKAEEEQDGAEIQIQGNGVGQIQIQGGGNLVLRRRMGFGMGNMPEPARLFQQFMQKACPRAMGNSMSTSNTRYEIRQQGEVNGSFSIDTAKNDFSLKLSEKNEPQRTLQVEEDATSGLTIRLIHPATRQMLVFIQAPHGAVSLTSMCGDETVSVAAGRFTELLKQHPGEVQTLLFRPLRELGVVEPLSPWLPPVMALACSGFSPPADETAKQADLLIAQLGNDDPETREKATQALIQLYPQAVQYVVQAQEKATDAESKMRLERVIAAHPAIGRARAFVDEKKLQDDKAYLRELLGSVPFFKAAARRRLTQLYGQDHGDDPKAWP